MNFSKMNFWQLWKLQHHTNLMRVTAAYHGMLARRTGLSSAFPSLAEKHVPFKLVCAWQGVLRMMTSKGLKNLLRTASEEVSPRFMPSMWTDLTFCYVKHNDTAHAEARARAIEWFAEQCGVPAMVVEHRGPMHHFVVRVETDQLGAEIIRYRRGVEWYRLSAEIFATTGLEPSRVLWWVPSNFVGLVNPCLKPIETPDYAQQVQEILQTAGT